jgi:intein/homing endonuclease
MGRFTKKFGPVYNNLCSDIFKFCEVMNFTPSLQQKQALEAVQRAQNGIGSNWIAVRSGQGPGKCLTGDSEVLDAVTGRLCTLEELAGTGRSISVYCMDTVTQKIKTAPAHAFPSGVKDCVVISTDAGQKISLSTDHPMFTPAGWKSACLLKEGDLVATPRRLQTPILPSRMTDNEVIFLAYMSADGGTAGGSCGFTQMPGKVLDEFLDVTVRLGGSTRRKKSMSKANEYGISGMRPLSSVHGLNDCLAKHKRIPPEVMGLPDRQLALFLNRFWACDGYIEKDGPGTCLASELLVRDIQTALLRFGIRSRVKYKACRYEKEGKVFDAWRLTVSGVTNLLTFYANIGMVLGKEPACQRSCNKALCKSENTNTDIVPIQIKEMQDIISDLGVASRKGQKPEAGQLTKGKIRKICRGRDYSYLSRDKFKAFCELADYQGKYRKLAENDIYWVRVRSTKSIGQMPVYDMEVPGVGNFVCNNLIVHNTALSTIIAFWRAFRSYKSLTIVTAPTMRQCKDVWLAEARRNLEKAEPWIKGFIKITKTRVVIAKDPEWTILTATATRSEAAQGFHQDNMTVIAEEASGIPRDLITQYKGTLSNRDALFLMIGNPNVRDCAFFDCFYGLMNDRWFKLVFNAEESPHVNPQRNKDLEEEFGRDSDVYRIRVLGEFPLVDPNCVMGSDEVIKCMDSAIRQRAIGTEKAAEYGGGLVRAFGLDFARMGGDENVLSRRLGMAQTKLDILPHSEPIKLVRMAFKQQEQMGWSDSQTLYVPDATGMGQGVLFSFYEQNKRVHEFHNHGTPYSSKYANKVTEGWFHMRGLVRKSNCYLIQDQVLLSQLSNRQYFHNKKGQIIVESKDDYIKRGNDSPDRADATIQSFYDCPFVPAKVSSRDSGTHLVGTGANR